MLFIATLVFEVTPFSPQDAQTSRCPAPTRKVPDKPSSPGTSMEILRYQSARSRALAHNKVLSVHEDREDVAGRVGLNPHGLGAEHDATGTQRDRNGVRA